MKRDKMRLTFGKGDAAVIVFVAILAVFTGCLFLMKTGEEQGNVAAVYKDGEKIRELPLNENAELFVTNAYMNRIVIKDGKVSITESDCPGGDCVHSGWISGNGRNIICLPNRVEIRIEGNREKEVDFILH